MSRLTAVLSLFLLATLPLALGCSSSTCKPIPDGVYTAIGPDGQDLLASAYPAPLASLGVDGAIDASLDALSDAATDAATHTDAAIHVDAAILTDAAAHPDAAANSDATDPPDAATGADAAPPLDAATAPDAAPPLDAGNDAATGVAVTYTFHNGLPEPYDTWSCTKPTASCEMSYVCTQGAEKVAIVTSYSASPTGPFTFSITPPGTIVTLRR